MYFKKDFGQMTMIIPTTEVVLQFGSLPFKLTEME